MHGREYGLGTGIAKIGKSILPKRISEIILMQKSTSAPIHYRPFDTRWTYYTGQSRWVSHETLVHNVMRHLLAKEQPRALCLSCCLKALYGNTPLITDKITENRYVSNRGSESSTRFPTLPVSRSRGIGVFLTERSAQSQTRFSQRRFRNGSGCHKLLPYRTPRRRFTGGDSRLYICDLI